MFDKSKRKSLKSISLVASIPVLSSLSFHSNAVTTSNQTKAKLNSNGWAVGNTDLITTPFPDDDIFQNPSMCNIVMTEQMILGPCYYSVTSSNDISSGVSGLPMQLCLRLVNNQCEPLANHEIEVWHTDSRGIYSADTSQSDDANRFRTWRCAGNDKLAKKSSWFRGSQLTDANGRVNFKTCFPGWYGGRTIHIHVRVKHNNQTSVTTQLCFDETLANEICSTHEKYSERGLQDTPLTQDYFFRDKIESSLITHQKNQDGSLLAFKTLKVL